MATSSSDKPEAEHGVNDRPADEKNGEMPQEKDGQNLGAISQDEPKRDQWSSKLDFVLSCIGFAVGLGNVWRFPYLCYKNGGGAFLIPYFICLVCGGVPVFFMEIALGQYMSQGGLGCWKICPIFQGIGIATTVICFLMNSYYIVLLAWDVYYLVMGLNSVLPWSHCNNTWNTERCHVFTRDPHGIVNGANETLTYSVNGTLAAGSSLAAGAGNAIINLTDKVDPVVEFWERKILQISSGIDEPGSIVWELALSLLFVWLLVYFCVWKGVKVTGKVVYFTATFPYIVLTILMIRGLTLEGAREGIIFYLKPDFTRLSDAQVWIDAGTQIFFSYAIALGAMTALGSYNKFTNNCYSDCAIIACVNSFTSLYAGFVIFSVLGFMAYEQGRDISEVAESGPGLAFIAYPKAVSLMPVAPLWAFLFFFMIILLGLDSQFVGVEAIITVIYDMFPRYLRRGYNKEIFIGFYIILTYFIGLTMVTNGGIYVFQLFDYYSASGFTLLWVCFFECVAIGWVYGGDRFYDNIEMMIGFRINPWLKFCWKFLTPSITAGIFLFSWSQFVPLKYNKTYLYPDWAQGLGLSFAFSSMICIPAYMLIQILMTPGTLKARWKKLTTPIIRPERIPSHWPEATMFLEQKQPFIDEDHNTIKATETATAENLPKNNAANNGEVPKEVAV